MSFHCRNSEGDEATTAVQTLTVEPIVFNGSKGHDYFKGDG